MKKSYTSLTHLSFLLASLAGANALADPGAYLFATFKNGPGEMVEQIYFAVSTNGRSWQALNKAEPVLVSDVGEKGVRDPYLLRSPDGKKFYLLATDLSIHFTLDWKRAQREGSKAIVIWDSADLVNWSRPRLVTVSPDDAGCTWAPEAVYDETKQEYLTFWASRTGRDEFAKQRIWAAWTKDFVTFEKPFIYIEKPWDVIDTTMVRVGEKIYRFSKDEQFKTITLEAGTNLIGSWFAVTNFSLSKATGYEGPSCYPLKPVAAGKPAWCLVLDHYRKRTGYQPFITEDIGSGQFQPGAEFEFPFYFRHGSVLPISTEELARLEQAYGSAKTSP